MMTFNLREVTKKRLGDRGLGAGRATGARPNVGAMSHQNSAILSIQADKFCSILTIPSVATSISSTVDIPQHMTILRKT
jgi:hypothetical protein